MAQGEPGRASSVNTVHGPTYGPVFQAGTVQGNVHVHHDTSPVHVVVPTTPDVRRSFGAGARVRVGDREYLVHDHAVEESYSADAATLFRRGRVSALGGGGTTGWLRQVEDRDDGWGGRALAAEHDLLARGNAPEVVQFHRDDRTTTLVTSWPRDRAGRPCDSLDVLVDQTPDHPLRWCGALAALCDALGAWHDLGVAHRGLAPAGIIVRDDGRAVPRDLGLAAHPARVGEHPGDHQAPEQRGRSTRGPGPWTDVHQVASVVHLLLTGRPPTTGTPLPVRAWEPGVPEPLATAVDACLAVDPPARPDVRWFGERLRAVHDRTGREEPSCAR
ncbi:hypothetical protein [Umezawaea tangerina]|uniref:Protein kinase domain-containing protein n=1 Tax=Umezawaea tangerina TaxID=84725 RepID=A0A2T0T420_9PSEU|nr:hypothetical protein [Umezawaea tangerina]PRY40416.1 hypothetical protein CLV43_106151 [Umezawaea tangerina]